MNQIPDEDKLKKAVRLHQEGKAQEAEILYLEMLQEEPENADLMYTLATLYLGQNRLDEALKWIDKALAEDAQAPAYHQLKGAILANQGQFEKALEEYKEAIEKNPNLYPALVGAGFIESQFGNMEQAKRHLKQAMRVNPDGLEANLHLADIHIEEGQVEKALEKLAGLEEAQPENTAIKLMIGKGLYEKRNWSGAERYFDKVLAMTPNNALARYYKALTQLWSGKLSQAGDEIKKFVKQFPETREAFMALGKTAFVEKQYAIAAKYLSQAAKRNVPLSVKLRLGQALAKLGHWPDARFWLLQVLEKQPLDSEAKITLAETYEFQGKHEKALETYEEIKEKDTRYLSALLGQARAHMALGSAAAAEQTAEKALELMPNHAEAMLLKLWSLFAQDNLAEADLFLLTIPFDKFTDKAKAPLLLSKALFEDHQKQYNAAWESFQKVPPERRVPLYPELTEEEIKTVQRWPAQIDDEHKIPTFVMGYDSTDVQAFSLWLKSQGLEVLNDRLAGLGREDIFYALQKVQDLDELEAGVIQNERAVYWERLKPWLGKEQDKDVVDFMFLNPHQGVLIKRFFPEAKVIVLQRHSQDIWLHQHAFGPEPIAAKDWVSTINQLINMGLNVEQINTDQWLQGDETTFKHLSSLFNKSLEPPRVRQLPWWRKGRFDAGHWKHYASHMTEEQKSLTQA